MRRSTGLVLGGIVALAIALRLCGIGFGLPYDLTSDEPHQIVQALKIGAGQGGPLLRMWHTVGKSGLDYLLFLEYAALFGWWRIVGRVADSQAFALQYLTDPTAFYLVGRVTVALLGAATCVAVYRVGSSLYGTRTGLAAALIAAGAYYPIAASHTINVHIPMACALWFGVAAFVAYARSGDRRLLVVAGLLAGAGVALAYSAAIGLLMLVVATISRSQPMPRRLADTAVLVGAAAVSIAMMSPDLLTDGWLVLRNFGAGRASGPPDVRSAIDSVTILRSRDWSGFADLLFKPDTVGATLAAAAAVVAAGVRREFWTSLFAATTIVFLVIVSASNRGLSEAYLLPVAPALWLLAARGADAISFGRRPVHAVCLCAVVAVPLYTSIREDVMLTKPDTRVLAKRWIEANVPSGSRILMDGMRFRFVQGVPLNPNRETVERRLANLETSELTLSPQMLSLYREAAERITPPVYELHSTVYGLEVEALDHYVRSGFAYVVVSSFNEKRYATDDSARQHPESARFYRDIKTDPRFRVVYSIEPVMWRQLGPTITVYRVECDPVGARIDQVS